METSEAQKNTFCQNLSKPPEEVKPEMKTLQKELAKLFGRKGRINIHKNSVSIKNYVNISQQKVTQIAIKLQNQVGTEIAKLKQKSLGNSKKLL